MGRITDIDEVLFDSGVEPDFSEEVEPDDKI